MSIKEISLSSLDETDARPQQLSESFERLFAELDARHKTIYDFVMRYSDYMYARHFYGTGEPLSMIEVHTLTYITDHPGCGVTELAQYWHKTKGALSQIVTKLTTLALVEKHKAHPRAKSTGLYATELGCQLTRAHKCYDVADITHTLQQIQEHCTLEEIDTFYKVLKVYYQVIDRDFEALPKE